jgi:hypothetical protein
MRRMLAAMVSAAAAALALLLAIDALDTGQAAAPRGWIAAADMPVAFWS